MPHVVYSDIDREFQPAPGGKLSYVTGDASIEQAIETALLWPISTRKFRPLFGTSIPNLLFAPITDGTAIMIKNEIVRAVQISEPRSKNVVVRVIPDFERLLYQLVIMGHTAGLREFRFEGLLSAEDA